MKRARLGVWAAAAVLTPIAAVACGDDSHTSGTLPPIITTTTTTTLLTTTTTIPQFYVIASGDTLDKIAAQYKEASQNGAPIAGQKIRELITVNGVRVVLADGTWGLLRASSNKPELVIVVESPTSEANMRAIFADIDARLAKCPEVGEYNQKI